MDESLIMIVLVAIPALILTMALVAFLRSEKDVVDGQEPRRQDEPIDEIGDAEIPPDGAVGTVGDGENGEEEEEDTEEGEEEDTQGAQENPGEDETSDGTLMDGDGEDSDETDQSPRRRDEPAEDRQDDPEEGDDEGTTGGNKM